MLNRVTPVASLSWYFLPLMLAFSYPANSANIVSKDLSYQAEKRLVKYQRNNPKLKRPTLSFQNGQQVEFNLSYRQLGQRWLSADVFYPINQTTQEVDIVIMIHGGGWRSGDKSHFYPLANLLAQRGYLVVLPQYRLSAEALYPAGLEDLLQAINWSAQYASQASIQRFDVNRVILAGGSSGGHLASLIRLAANDETWPFYQQLTTPIDAIVNLDGLLATTTEQALQFENRKGASSALALWLGGEYQKRPQLWREISPHRYKSIGDPALLVISSGQLRFTSGKELFNETYAALGNVYQYQELKNVEHTFWLFEPYLTPLAESIHGFLNRLESNSLNN